MRSYIWSPRQGCCQDSTSAKLRRLTGFWVQEAGLHQARSQGLHWLPVQQRIWYKIALLTFKALHGMAPAYITELVEEHKPRRALRSAFDVLLRPPKISKTKFYGERAFAVAAHTVILHATLFWGKY